MSPKRQARRATDVTVLPVHLGRPKDEELRKLIN